MYLTGHTVFVVELQRRRNATLSSSPQAAASAITVGHLALLCPRLDQERTEVAVSFRSESRRPFYVCLALEARAPLRWCALLYRATAVVGKRAAKLDSPNPTDPLGEFARVP